LFLFIFISDLILIFGAKAKAKATFSNISAISWRPVLVVEEAGERTTDHWQATGKLYHLRLRVECTALALAPKIKIKSEIKMKRNNVFIVVMCL
jgi:hypothetical protein